MTTPDASPFDSMTNAKQHDGMYAWGHNSQGDLGTTDNRLLPVKVQLPPSVT